MKFSTMVRRLVWRSQTNYFLEVALLIVAPFDFRNWYTLTINILSLILNVLPRYLLQKFLQSRPRMTVLHHILISLVYAEHIFSLFYIVLLVGNYFPVSVLETVLKNHLACSIISVIFHTYLLHLFSGILLLSLTRLLINKTPFWYDGLDHDRLKIWVHISLAIGSITGCLTGYRAATWDYCDWASYDFIISLFGIASVDKKALKSILIWQSLYASQSSCIWWQFAWNGKGRK